jgi:hypothetical protein
MKKILTYLLLIITLMIGSLFLFSFYTEENKTKPEPSFVWKGVTYILTFEPVKELNDTSNNNTTEILNKGYEIGKIKSTINKQKVPQRNGESNYLNVGDKIYDTKISSKTKYSYYDALVVKYENKYRITRPTGKDIDRLSKLLK